MVDTRSQILRENRVEQSEDDRFPDNDDNVHPLNVSLLRKYKPVSKKTTKTS